MSKPARRRGARPPRQEPQDQPRESSVPGAHPPPIADAEDRHPRHWMIAAAVVIGLFLLYQSNRSTLNGGDTRGLVDLAYWVSQTDAWSLDGHPGYRGDLQGWGYWAVRTDSGRIATVYPPAGLLYSVPGMWIAAAAGYPLTVWNAAAAAKGISAAMIALTCGLFYLVARRHGGERAALVAAVLLGASSPYWGCMAQALWSQNGAIFSQALSCLFLSMLDDPRKPGWRRRMGAVLAGFFATWALFCRPTFAPWTLAALAWVVWRLGRDAWPSAIGVAVAALLGLSLNKLATGSMEGLYLAKAAGEGGFDWRPGSLLRAAAGVLVSPGRGIFVFAPWTLLVPAALVWLAGRRRWAGEQARLLPHAFFVLSVFGSLAAFRLWDGGYSPGARLTADGLLSGAFLVHAFLGPLLARLAGAGLVLLLAVPGVFVQARIAAMGSTLSEHYAPAPTDMARHFVWRTSALRWYVTDGAPLREYLGAAGDPMAPKGLIGADDPNAARFIERGVVAARSGDGTASFHMIQRRARWRFVLPAELREQDLVAGLSLLPTGLPGHTRTIRVSINGTRVARFAHTEGTDKFIPAVQVPRSLFKSGETNIIEIRDERPPLGEFGPLFPDLAYIGFLPAGRIDPERIRLVGGK